MKQQAMLSSWFTAASKKAAFGSDPEPDPEELSQQSATEAPPESPDVRSIVLPDTAAAVRANCTAVCCDPSAKKPFQPTDKTTLSSFTVNNHSFQPQWYGKCLWLTVCMTTNKAYCLYCKYAMQHNLITFS